MRLQNTQSPQKQDIKKPKTPKKPPVSSNPHTDVKEAPKPTKKPKKEPQKQK